MLCECAGLHTTRASLISGKPVHEHGMWSFADPELRHGTSHVRNIRDAGYHTAVVGKTHLRHGQRHTHDHLDEMHDWRYVDPSSGRCRLSSAQDLHLLLSVHEVHVHGTTPCLRVNVEVLIS